MSNNLFKSTLLLAAGALVGAAAALLLNPDTSEKVRGKVKDFAEEGKKRAQDFCEQVKQDIENARKNDENAPQQA